LGGGRDYLNLSDEVALGAGAQGRGPKPNKEMVLGNSESPSVRKMRPENVYFAGPDQHKEEDVFIRVTSHWPTEGEGSAMGGNCNAPRNENA